MAKGHVQMQLWWLWKKNAQRDRLCTIHYHLRHQAEKGIIADGDGVKNGTSDKVAKFCSDSKCRYPVYCNWLCKQHYEQTERNERVIIPQSMLKRMKYKEHWPAFVMKCSKLSCFYPDLCTIVLLHHHNKCMCRKQINQKRISCFLMV